MSTIKCEQTWFEKMKRRVGREYLSETWERKYYADRYTCFPPPLFIPIITIIEVSGRFVSEIN